MGPATWRPWPGIYPGWPEDSPYDYKRIAIKRRGSDEIRRVDVANLDPRFNVGDLEWRPASPPSPPERNER